MKNEEKAIEIYKDNLYDCEVRGLVQDKQEILFMLEKMAKWKDERVKSCFILISKLIKDGVLAKDNIEHIMVEQMIELYNNLKI